MKNLITGIHGFAGSHLADGLLKLNEEVVGLARPGSDSSNIKHIEKQVQVFPVDIRDRQELKKVLAAIRPGKTRKRQQFA